MLLLKLMLISFLITFVLIFLYLYNVYYIHQKKEMYYFSPEMKIYALRFFFVKFYRKEISIY